jgi:hypothetical protein
VTLTLRSQKKLEYGFSGTKKRAQKNVMFCCDDVTRWCDGDYDDVDVDVMMNQLWRRGDESFC